MTYQECDLCGALVMAKRGRGLHSRFHTRKGDGAPRFQVEDQPAAQYDPMGVGAVRVAPQYTDHGAMVDFTGLVQRAAMSYDDFRAQTQMSADALIKLSGILDRKPSIDEVERYLSEN